MGHFSKEDFRRSLADDRETPPKNNQKRKQTPEDKKRLEEDWKKYKKQFPNTGDRKKYSGWDYDEDDGER